MLRFLYALAFAGALLAGTPASNAQPPAAGTVSTSTIPATPATPSLSVSHNRPLDANDPLQQWFQQQDLLFDDILVRLSRIEQLVQDIHRLIMQWPSAPSTAQISPSAAAGTADTRAAGIDPLDLLPAWAPPLGSAALIALLVALLVVLLALAYQRYQRQRRQQPQPLPHAPGKPPAAAPAAIARTTTTTAPPAPASHPPGAPSAAVSATASSSRAEESSRDTDLPHAGVGATDVGHADQALELADIMLSMGLGHGAAQTLTEQIRNEPKQALRHWLKLLEIYRKNGQQAEFEKSAEELRLHFNVQPEDWQMRPDGLRSIEDYPHIAARMVELWGRPACYVYLQNLLADNRGGARLGFPQPVAEELLLLTALLSANGARPGNDSAGR